jgi:hypothetical protein
MSNQFAPIRVTVEFAFTDGNQVAKAGFECPVGDLPSREDIATAAANVMAQVQSQLGDSFKWQSRHDFMGDEMAERTGGMRFAVPGSDKWEAEWANVDPALHIEVL